MVTSFDKAVVALIMALIFFANKFFNTSIAVDEQTVSSVVMALTPIVVYLFPNKGPVDKSGV